MLSPKHLGYLSNLISWIPKKCFIHFKQEYLCYWIFQSTELCTVLRKEGLSALVCKSYIRAIVIGKTSTDCKRICALKHSTAIQFSYQTRNTMHVSILPTWKSLILQQLLEVGFVGAVNYQSVLWSEVNSYF